ncbi:MAG: hypothetical protein A2035_02990 [Nitrospirae bacterium GWA2_42_11]|nr:MAG: hypothetical protein A2035_02990 [Nitrospirae bacterium GWA2_42_11]OGW59774.1 MAG: hypothetical protein A3D21_08260 [Nitrospirae bacterium RIFCSPHIGHO2_02_FULL_42_12]HAS18164.1 SAP domain-containing protein [Nitrospiraceae bacterium]
MTLTEIKKIAQKLGLPTTAPKTELIKSIQRKEGNFDCFGTTVEGFCDQFNCMWRADCLKPANRAQ